MPKMIIKIHKGKLLSADVDGVKGPTCMKETQKYLDGLGLKAEDFVDTKTPEFREEPATQVQG